MSIPVADIDDQVIFSDDKPVKLVVTRTVVVKERPKDAIIHTCQLSYCGWEWFITMRSKTLRALFLSLRECETKALPKRKRRRGRTPTKQYNKNKVQDDGSQGGNDHHLIEPNAIPLPNNPSTRERGLSVEGDTILNELKDYDGRANVMQASQRSTVEGKEDKDPNRQIHTIAQLKKLVSRKFYKTDEESLEYQREVIETYFAKCFASKWLKNAPDLLEALEVSPQSFLEEMGPSYKEGYVKVRCSADSRDKLLKSDTERAICGQAAGFNCCCCVCFCFKKKITTKRRVRVWAIIKNGSVSFYNNRACTRLIDVIMFQPSTVISDQLVVTGTRNGAVMIDSAWMAEFKFDSTILQKQWLAALNAARNRCPWVERDRFNFNADYTGSMTTQGSHSALAQWFTTPQDLWEEIYESLLNAETQVFIAGWWISPEIFLKRPGLKYPESRLDAVLEKIAQRGVKVYILQYKEPKVMCMNSPHSREVFLSLDHRGNIQYLRHGDFTFPFIWSHHEKLVVIDQDISFVGGVDLCFGRWDTPEYRICDDGPKEEQLWLGKG